MSKQKALEILVQIRDNFGARISDVVLEQDLNKAIIDLSMAYLQQAVSEKLEVKNMQQYMTKVLEVQKLQAKIDQLMLEFCPEDMTAEQKANWAKHQRVPNFKR